MLSIIAVVGKNRAIGKNNKLLWNIPEDLEHFKKITTGHVVVMGDKTFASLNRPLPDRFNIVLSLNPDFQAEGCTVCHSLEEGLKMAGEKEKELARANSRPEEIFIIGGGKIYELALPLAGKLYLTLVDDTPEADTFFPDYGEFKNILSEEERESGGLKYKFMELTR